MVHLLVGTRPEDGRLMVGGGIRIFPDDREKWTFELAELRRFESGAVLHTYRLAGS